MSCMNSAVYATNVLSAKLKTNTVFGCGNQNARLMFVGSAGEQEDKQGIPFVGAAGKLLDKYLDAVEILRDEVYIANILKCRPPHNRDPLPEEGDACIGFLREQVKLIRPELIVVSEEYRQCVLSNPTSR